MAKKTTTQYTDEFKAELDRRYEEYEQGGKVFTREEVNERIKKLLKDLAASKKNPHSLS